MIKYFLLCSFLVQVSFATEATSSGATVQPVTPETLTESAAPMTTNIQAQPEDQIPLKIDQQVKASESTTNGTKMVLSLMVIAGMLGAAYYMIRRYSVSNKTAKSNMQIKVLSQHFLGPKKSLAIIRVAGESILIGVTDHNISLIKPLSLLDDELPQVLPKNFDESMVKDTLAGNVSVENMLTKAEQSIEEDDFAFAGLKTTVTQKLKGMRNIQ